MPNQLNRKNKYIGSLYLALAASIWGGMYVVVKVTVAVIPPFELVWMRYLVALIALLIVGLITRQSWRIHKRDVPLILVIGLVGYTLSIVLQETGTLLSSAQMGAMITSSTPAFMVVFARILLRELLTWRKVLSVSFATLGVLLIVGGFQSEGSHQLGSISLVVAALTWALMSVLVKRVPSHYSQLVVTTYGIFVALVALTPIVVGQLHLLNVQQLMHPAIWGGVLYLGVVSTAGGFLLWNRGLQMLNASSGGVFFFFQPLVGTLLGWLLLGEQIGVMFWIGAVLILGGVLFVIRE
ncbi:DMT family transporter [Tumebacillus permanentifrigoris]|uniref:Threonine/homoserine efflux transporter RhtA n=1 Tax=Tumebacillus permanentifrigoris TaxID=378543 RepID=A0A316D754_9BACL|nr:DMT family transporter [Tumebacillus permanentifrigoris]PWK11550.1 threonine/homoserine efflux transporter RhtA [Tumebacillus permanentifrigoris]